jgi:oligopeptide/dipeptide ABC transporter ATP-binding protein
MYAGRIVEDAGVFELYERPAHPYTRGLLPSIPRLDQGGEKLATIPGLPPNLTRIPPGCPFHPRCPVAQPICASTIPDPISLGADRTSACHLAKDVLDGRV